MFLPYQLEYWWAFQNQNTPTVIRSEFHLLVELVLPFELDRVAKTLSDEYRTGKNKGALREEHVATLNSVEQSLP